MGATSVRLAGSLREEMREVAQRDNISIKKMITAAATERLAAEETGDSLGSRAERGSRAKYLRALRKSLMLPMLHGVACLNGGPLKAR